MSDDTTEVRISIGTDDNGAMVMVVTANPDGTTPACYIKFWIDPDMPNSYEEFETVSSIVTDEFLTISGEAMKDWIAARVAEADPEAVAAVTRQVNEGLLLQGFSPEQVAELERLSREDG
jgi:hypothetical protein